jgi:hypothetical protein
LRPALSVRFAFIEDEEAAGLFSRKLPPLRREVERHAVAEINSRDEVPPLGFPSTKGSRFRACLCLKAMSQSPLVKQN